MSANIIDPTAAGGCLPDPLEYCVFMVGKEEYAIASSHVLGLCLDHPVTAPANDPACIKGAIHWQGAEVPVLDLGMLLKLDAGGAQGMHTVIVVKIADGMVGVLVDQVLEAMQPSARQITPLLHSLRH